MTKHTAVWLDHREARVFTFHPGHADEATVTAHSHHEHHRASNGQEGLKEKPEDAKRFFHTVIGALHGTEELLIVGPGTAKLELLRYIHGHDRALEATVVGIETVDHPTDGQLVAFSKKYFQRVDTSADALV